jgi:heme-degrading monooxygenase HmoA
MFTRHVTMQLKKNWAPEFPAVIEKEVLPLLRRQKGFHDEVVLLAPNKTEVVAISVWETKEFADIYNRESYPQVLNILNKYIEGVPLVKTYEVMYATLPAYEKFTMASAR